tara:strand:+ start:953 stop:1516 length:564 start_codon:yes stop_codon:yes gene_type:complete
MEPHPFSNAIRDRKLLATYLESLSEEKSLPIQGLFSVIAAAIHAPTPPDLIAFLKKSQTNSNLAQSLQTFIVSTIHEGTFDAIDAIFLTNSPAFELELVFSALNLKPASYAPSDAMTIIEDWIGENPDFPLVNVVYPEEEMYLVNPSNQNNYVASNSSISDKKSLAILGGVTSAAILLVINTKLQED